MSKLIEYTGGEVFIQAIIVLVLLINVVVENIHINRKIKNGTIKYFDYILSIPIYVYLFLLIGYLLGQYTTIIRF